MCLKKNYAPHKQMILGSLFGSGTVVTPSYASNMLSCSVHNLTVKEKEVNIIHED